MQHEEQVLKKIKWRIQGHTESKQLHCNPGPNSSTTVKITRTLKKLSGLFM